MTTEGVKNAIWAALKVFICLLIIGLLFSIAYWAIYLRGIKWKQIHLLIADESKKYVGHEAATEKILLQGAKEIVNTRHLNTQARTYASDNKIPLERVIVDNTIAAALMFGYIKKPAPVTNPNANGISSNTNIQ